MVLGGRVGQVVEDYDSGQCSTLYSDSALSSSPRPEAVSLKILRVDYVTEHVCVCVCLQSDSDSEGYLPAYRRGLKTRVSHVSQL